MDLLKITQKFEMTQQIRTISRANGLRHLINYYSVSQSRDYCSEIEPISPRSRSSKFPRRYCQQFQGKLRVTWLTIFDRCQNNTSRHSHVNILLYTFLLITLLLHKYVSLAAQRYIFHRRIYRYSKNYNAYKLHLPFTSYLTRAIPEKALKHISHIIYRMNSLSY